MAATSSNGAATLAEAGAALERAEAALKDVEHKVAPEHEVIAKAEAAVKAARDSIAGHRPPDPPKGLAALKAWRDQNNQTNRTLAVAALFLVGAALIAVFVHKHAPFQPGTGFLVFAGFYVVAQAIERLIELLALSPVPPNATTAETASEDDKSAAEKKTTAQKTLIFAALSVLLGAAASVGFGLYFLRAVGVTAPPYWLDVIVTALLLSGGTKALHDLIEKVTAAKEAAKANA